MHTRHRSKFLPPQRVLEITELSPEEEAVEKFLRKNLKAILKLRGEVERVSSSAEYVGDPGTKRDGSASEPKLLACRRPSVRPRPFPPPYSPTQQEPASHSGCPCAVPVAPSLPPSLGRARTTDSPRNMLHVTVGDPGQEHFHDNCIHGTPRRAWPLPVLLHECP